MAKQDLSYKLSKQIEVNEEQRLTLAETEQLVRINRNLENQLHSYQQEKINLKIQCDEAKEESRRL